MTNCKINKKKNVRHNIIYIDNFYDKLLASNPTPEAYSDRKK